MTVFEPPKLVRLLTAGTAFEAEAISQALRTIGVAALIKTRPRRYPSQGLAYGALSGMIHEEHIFDLWVPADHAARAREFLDLPETSRWEILLYRIVTLGIILLLILGMAFWLNLL